MFNFNSDFALSGFVVSFALFFGGAWGAAENRCWKEAGDGWILSHFKLYHLLIGLLFKFILLVLSCCVVVA